MAKHDPATLKSQAAAALDRGRHKKALQAYLELEKLEPTDGQWPRRVADMYRRLNKTGPAIAALQRAADKYIRAGFLVKAIAMCKMILQLDPEHSEVQERLAALNAERGLPGHQAAVDKPADDAAGEELAAKKPVQAAPVGEEPVQTAPAAKKPAPPAPAAKKPAPPMPAAKKPAPPVPAAKKPVPAPGTARAAGPVLPTPAEFAMQLADELVIELTPEPAPTPPPGPGKTAPPSDPAQSATPRPEAPAKVAALADQHQRRRRKRSRTIPPDMPLEAVTLGAVVPGATPELTDDGHDSGIIEIPLEEIEIVDDNESASDSERALRKTPLLSALGPEAMRRLIAEISLVELAPGQVLFREGEPGRTLYIITEGGVSVITEGPPRVHLSQLGEGDFFGEIALVTNQPRTATIEADPERGAQLLALDRTMIGNLVEEEPKVLQALLRFFRDRLVDRLVQVSPLFAPYAGEEGHDLASRFRFLEVHKGTMVLEQGRRASGLFILLAGQLEALHKGDTGVRRLGTLSPGGVFGEMSLLANRPAIFTVRATVKSFILQMPAAMFRQVIMTHPQVLMFVSELAEERRRRYEAIVAGDADYDAGRITLL